MPDVYCASMALGLPPRGPSAVKTAMECEIVVYFPQGKRTLRALVDSGAQDNFISQKVIVEEGVRAPLSNITAHAVDGHQVRVYGRHALETHATDARHATRAFQLEYIAADVIKYDALLGYPWLSQCEPDIHWRRGAWYHRAASMTDVQMVSITEMSGAEESIFAIYLTPQPVDRIGDAGVALYYGAVEDIKLHGKIAQYEDVFSEEAAGKLPENTKVRHSIEIEDGKTVPYGPIYPLSANELRVLREYIESSLAKGWIRRSESPAGAPILFVQKKDGGLRLCVDYRGLNSITVKNRHPLPLISETIDRLAGAAVYTKLDLRDAYHRIRIAESDV